MNQPVRFRVLGLCLCVCALLSDKAHSYFESSRSKTPDPEMNGIRMSSYPEFWSKWRLVTVRYRLDTSEMRFTYANESAWKALNSLKGDYPDDAVFAKIGRKSEGDPAFPSSAVPSGAKRFQFMVRNKKKYASTGGWGYALFDETGQRFDEDPVVSAKACAACHNLVPERGFVFSRPLSFEFASTLTPKESTAESLQVQTEPLAKSKWPKKLQDEIFRVSGSVPDTVDAVVGPLLKSAFSGTLDEIVPFLIQTSMSRKRTAVLVLNDGNFSAVIPLAKTCESRKDQYHVFIAHKGSVVRQSDICQ